MVDIESRARARRIAQRRGLGALANDTKWGEFFPIIIEARIPVEVKLIDDEQVFQCRSVFSPTGNYIEGPGGLGPVLFVFVEWICSSFVEQVQAAALAAGLECEVGDGIATVFGYR